MDTEKPFTLNSLTYKMDKRDAARQAAAAYIWEPSNALRQYMILTGIMEQLPENWRESLTKGDHPDWTPADYYNPKNDRRLDKLKQDSPELAEQARIYADARTEMRENLPGYRLPCNDGFVEYSRFLAKVPEFEMTGYSHPPWLKELEQSGIPEHLLNEIKQHAKDCADYLGRVKEAEAKLKELQETIDKAKSAYKNKEGRRTEQRNKEVVQILGFSTGKAQKRIDHKAAYLKYVYLIRHKGMHREDATLQIQSDFGYQSRDSTLKALHECVNNVLKQHKEDSPSVFEDCNIQQYFKDLVLTRR